MIAKFGKNTPSIGFAVIIDELLSALGRQKIEIETGHCNLIVYTDATLNWAVSLACDLREKGKCIELLKRAGIEVVFISMDNEKLKMES